MGRRDDDPRPPIEIVGAEPEVASLQRVTRGGRPSRRSTLRALVLAAGGGSLLLLGLTLGDDAPPVVQEPARSTTTSRDQPSSTTTRPTTTTTTTTTTLPVGPVFGTPVGGVLLTFSSAWTVVDLDTGARRPVDLPVEGDPWSSLAVSGGIVLVGGPGREAVFVELQAGLSPSEPVVLGPADQVLLAGRPDQVWLVDSGGVFEGVPDEERAVARLVDLSGTVLRSFELPQAYPEAGTADGLVVQAGGQVFLVDEGGPRALGTGSLIGAAGGSAVAMMVCDDRAACRVARVDAAGSSIGLLPLDAPFRSGASVVVARDGRLAVWVYAPEGARAALFDPFGRSLGTLPLGDGDGYGAASPWLPDDLGLAIVSNSEVRWARWLDGAWVVTSVPALADLRAEVAWIIEP